MQSRLFEHNSENFPLISQLVIFKQMEEGRIYTILKKYREENQKAMKEMQLSLEATISHFNTALTKIEAANDEFASEISDHIVDLDTQLSKLEKRR